MPFAFAWASRLAADLARSRAEIASMFAFGTFKIAATNRSKGDGGPPALSSPMRGVYHEAPRGASGGRAPTHLRLRRPDADLL